MDENLWFLLVVLICLVFLLLLLFMSCFLRNRDFTRSYVLFTVVPMIINSANRFIIILNLNFEFAGVYSKARRVLSLIASFINPMSDFSLATGTIVFLIMSMVAASGRREFGAVATWFPYLLTTSLSSVLGAVQMYFFYTDLRFALIWLLFAFFAFCMILTTLIPFVFCCCTTSNPGKSSSPVVYNAKSRLGWAFIFAIFALFPTVTTTILDASSYNIFEYYYFYNFISVSQPIFFVLSAILFLPTYRTVVFFCSSDEKDFRNSLVTPIQAPNNFATQAITPHQAPLAPQAAQPYQQQVDQNSVAYATNPSQQQNLSNQLAVPSASQCPNCQCQPIKIMQQQQPLLLQPTAHLSPEMMAQQMPIQTTVQTTISHNHQPMVQSNLVRFASQPNLVQFNTMQPAYSMPQLASVQSPFVVQQ